MFVREYVLSKMSKDLFMYAVQWGKKEEKKKRGQKSTTKNWSICKQNLLFQVKLYAMNTEKYNPIKAQQQKKEKRKKDKSCLD